MAMGNTVNLVGNVTRDPELRYAPTGVAVASIGLAVNSRRRDKQSNDWIEEVSFFDVVCFGSLGENVADSVQKGTRVVVAGRLEQRSWETNEGDKRYKIEVIADEVAPSLRWATAVVTKTPPQSGRGDHPAGRGSGSDGGYDYNREPF